MAKKEILKVVTESGSTYRIDAQDLNDGRHARYTLRTKEGLFEIILFSQSKLSDYQKEQIRNHKPTYLPKKELRVGVCINAVNHEGRGVYTGRIVKIFKKTGLFKWQEIRSDE
ncbi:MAG: hypothetical protein Q8O89_05840 [Nanoarchaeota archaeon]|nr:hypothetical protein [Nanoarchaeota archaeon]